MASTTEVKGYQASNCAHGFSFLEIKKGQLPQWELALGWYGHAGCFSAAIAYSSMANS
jgi:hypothetical protein